MNSKELVQKTKSLVAQERSLAVAVIECLEQIQARKIFAEYGYGSLFEFCLNELGYSRAAAQRRIDVMRISRELPEVKDAIKTGVLQLSTVSRVESFARQQKIVEPIRKRELIDAVAGKSDREAEKYLASVAPHPVPKEKERVLNATEVEISFVADEEIMQNFEKLRALWAHRNSRFSYAELIRSMQTVLLQGWRKSGKNVLSAELVPAPELKRSLSLKSALETKSGLGTEMESDSALDSESAWDSESNSNSDLARHSFFGPPNDSRYISKKIKQALFLRDNGQCQFKSSITGRRCGSSFGIQIDHVIPYALGGTGEVHNLQLLCRVHNRYRSERTFGQYSPTIKPRDRSE